MSTSPWPARAVSPISSQGRHIRLDAVKIVVVDEADRMSDMGFLPEVRRLLDQTPDTRQTLLFSATLDGAVDVLVRRYQRHPVRHELVGSAEEDAHTEHYFWRVESTDRAEMTAQIAAVSGPTIVFCRTRHSADRTARQLIARGIRAVAIHGDRSQAQRERALSSFAAGHAVALVATDVAARGIHVDGVAAVVHFDPPADAKDYVHRSGRTARAGATGIVVSLVTPDKTKAVKQLQRDLGVPGGIVGPDLSTLPTGDTAVSRRQKPLGAVARPRHGRRGGRIGPRHRTAPPPAPGRPRPQAPAAAARRIGFPGGTTKPQNHDRRIVTHHRDRQPGPSTRRVVHRRLG